MTDQAVQATVSNARMGKIFTKTATDDQWDGNTLTDSLSGQQIGILMPSTTITESNFNTLAGFAHTESKTLNLWSFNAGALA